MTANNMSPNQKDLLLRAADYLTKDGAVEDVEALASAARLLRKFAQQDQPAMPADKWLDEFERILDKALHHAGFAALNDLRHLDLMKQFRRDLQAHARRRIDGGHHG